MFKQYRRWIIIGAVALALGALAGILWVNRLSVLAHWMQVVSIARHAVKWTLLALLLVLVIKFDDKLSAIARAAEAVEDWNTAFEAVDKAVTRIAKAWFKHWTYIAMKFVLVLVADAILWVGSKAVSGVKLGVLSLATKWA